MLELLHLLPPNREDPPPHSSQKPKDEGDRFCILSLKIFSIEEITPEIKKNSIVSNWSNSANLYV